MGIYSQYFLQPKNLYETYTHSHISTFMTTYTKTLENKIDKIKGKLSSTTSPVIKELKKWSEEIKSIENKYFEDFKKTYAVDEGHPELKNKDDFLALLNREFFKGEGKTFLPSWEKVKTVIVKNSSSTKKQDPILEQKALNNFRQQLTNIGKEINNFIDSYKRVSETKELIDQKVYKDSYNNLVAISSELKGFVLDVNLPQEEQRKQLNDLFKRAIKATIDIGWLIEPITREILNKALEKKSLVVGAKYKDKKTVIDILLPSDISVPIRYGVNVKSQKEKYSITRSNLVSNPLLELGSFEKDLGYLRRNLAALNTYSVNYEKFDRTSFDKLYKEFLKIEKDIAFLNNLMYALDGIRKKDAEISIYSILISFQGGFLWTSDVIKSIEKQLPDFILRRSPIKIISARFQMVGDSDKARLKELFRSKRIALKAMPKNGMKNSDVYEALSKLPENQIKRNTLINSVTYTINLANAMGGNK